MRLHRAALGVALLTAGLIVGLLLGRRGTDQPPARVAAERELELLRSRVQELTVRLDRRRARTMQTVAEEAPSDEAPPVLVPTDRADTPADTVPSVPTATPQVVRLPVPGAEKLLARVDVPLIASLGRVLQRVARHDLDERDGHEPDELPDGLRGGAYDLLSNAAAELTDDERRPSHWVGLSDPAILANLIVQQLDDHGMSASETVRHRLADTARRWREEASRRARIRAEVGAEGRPAPRLRRMVDRMDVNLGFVDEAFALLTPQQSEAIRPAKTRGLAYADPYVASTTIDYSLYDDRTTPETMATIAYPIRGAHDAVVEIGTDWSATLAADERGQAPRGAHGPTMRLVLAAQVRATANAQARLIERLLAEVELSESAVDELVQFDQVVFFRGAEPPR